MLGATGSIEIYDLCGLLGFSLYAVAYAMVTMKRLSSEDIAFYALNGLGAICVLISLSMNFNLGSLMVQMFYIVTSFAAIAMRMRSKDDTAKEVPPQYPSQTS